MVATTIPTPLVTSDIDGSTQIGAGVRLLTSTSNLALGLGTPLTLGPVGDSIGDNNIGGKANNSASSAVWGADSVFFHMIAEHFNPNVEFNGVKYEDGGFAVALGGSTTEDLLNRQTDLVVARPPDISFMCPGQNDNIVDAASAEASVARITASADRIRKAVSTGLIVQGLLPKGIIAGGARVEALSMANAMLRANMSAMPGVEFADVLSILKDPTGANEVAANPSVPFKAGYSGDQVHFSPDGSRAIAALYARIFRKLVGERQLVEIAARDYSQAYPWGSYFGGRRALMMGTGGTINGTASNDVPAGWVINYPTDGGLTLVPSIVVGADGYRRFVMSWTGTATEEVVLTMRAENGQPCEAGLFGAEMLADHTAVEGWGVNFNTPICNVGNETWDLTGPITGTRLFRSPRRVPFSNGFATKAMTISALIRSGRAPKGSIGVYRASMTRQGDVQ